MVTIKATDRIYKVYQPARSFFQSGMRTIEFSNETGNENHRVHRGSQGIYPLWLCVKGRFDNAHACG
jgi:hypothetical protein